MQAPILRNMAKCLICNETIESTHRHDFVKCSCGNLHVDGGKDYLKRGAEDFSQVEELSTHPTLAPEEKIEEYYKKARTFQSPMFSSSIGIAQRAIAEFLANQDGHTIYKYET